VSLLHFALPDVAKIFSLFTPTERIPQMPLFRNPKVKGVILRLFVSAGASWVLGFIAMGLYFFSFCSNGGTDCMAYSPTRRWIAFLLAPPIFVMQSWFLGTLDRVSNFDPVVVGKFGWAAMWAYYFALISAVEPLIRRIRKA
jgi:hypothetical protein